LPEALTAVGELGEDPFVGLCHRRKLVMVALDQLAEAVHRAAEAGPGRVELLVPDTHGHVKVGQAVTRPAGQ
jgi:hypothetical protein